MLEGKGKMGEKLEGLGGWLILFQIFLILIIPYSILYGLALMIGGALNGSGSGIPFVYQLKFLFLLFGNITSLFLFYTKRKKFITWFLIWLWSITAIYGLIDPGSLMIFASMLQYKMGFYELISPETSAFRYFLEFFVTLAISTILTLYIKKSERVKNTFVN